MKSAIMNLRSRLSGLHKDERGITTVEYIIVLVLIAITAYAVWDKFGTKVRAVVNTSSGQVDKLNTAAGTPPE